MQTAKLFINGRSQAVRLTKDFRIEGDEVFIERVGDAVVLLPRKEGWSTLERALAAFEPGFVMPDPHERRIDLWMEPHGMRYATRRLPKRPGYTSGVAVESPSPLSELPVRTSRARHRDSSGAKPSPNSRRRTCVQHEPFGVDAPSFP